VVKVTLEDIVGPKGIFTDGDWVETKDQDPNGNVRLIQLADVGDGIFVNKSSRYMNSAKASELRCTCLEPGDILIARMPDPIGRACIFPGLDQPSVTVVDVCILRPDLKKVCPRWLLHKINGEDFRRAVSFWITGTTRQRISRGNLSKIEFTLPSLSEQQRIASVLDKADALRRKRKRAVDLLNSLTQSIFLEMFGGRKDPVYELKDVVKKGTIVTYGIVQAGPEYPGGVPYIRTGDLVDGNIQIEGLKLTDPAIAARFSRSRVDAGDIVMSIRATVGTTAVVPPALKGANLTQGTARIAPGEDVQLNYLLEYIRAENTQRWIAAQVKGATFLEITLGRLRELPVAVPPLALQNKFSKIVMKVRRGQACSVRQAALADSLFSSLQSVAFSGPL
jgi:type I restriction enzyme, S subunit